MSILRMTKGRTSYNVRTTESLEIPVIGKRQPGGANYTTDSHK